MSGQVRPILIGSRNCEMAIGQTWRWLRDHAAELQLEILAIDGKRFIEADAALEAIRKFGTVERAESPVDELAQMRAKLGKRRRSA